MRLSYFLIITFIVEYFLFRHYVLTDITPFYPANFDQQSFLMMIYGAMDRIQHHGVWQGLLESPALPTGVLFPLQVILFFVVFGVSRFNGLLINFIYFIALQFFFTHTVKKISGSHFVALIALGLLLAVNVPFMVPGGITDLRMDFIAFCLYGMAITAMVRSDVFRYRSWSLVASALTILLILMRTLSVLYISGIVIFILGYFLLHKDAHQQARVKNLLLFSVIVLAVVFPVLWVNKTALYNYYVVGHITGNEKFIRAALTHTTDFWKSLFYYPGALLIRGIGKLTMLFILLMLGIAWMVQRRWRASFSPISFCLLLALFVPMVILTLDMQKSAVVSTVMVIPLLWLIVIALLKMQITQTRYWLPIITGATLLLATYTQGMGYYPKLSTAQKTDLKNITAMHLAIGDYATSHHWPSITLSLDQIDDRVTSGTLTALYFEKRHRMLWVNNVPLGGAIFAISKSDAIKSLEKSNVAIFDVSHTKSNHGFPLNAAVDRMKPALVYYLLRHYSLLKIVKIGRHQFAVFVRTP